MALSQTPAVVRALEVAALIASARGSEITEPMDLLQAMLQEEDGRAMTLLVAGGLKLPTEEVKVGQNNPANLSSRTERLVITARETAYELGEGALSSEALLLTILREEQSLVDWLVARGLDWPKLLERLQPLTPIVPTIEENLSLNDPVEHIDLARILDVCLNRSAEALRVIEDYCRFVLDDGTLSREAKEIRHDLRRAIVDANQGQLLAARDTLHDVGTQISTASEGERANLLAVLRANFKRLQEALRSLEEYGKVRETLNSGNLEQLRYRSYTLERALFVGVRSRELLRDARLYVLLTAATCASSMEWTISEIAEAGASVVQLREKSLSDADFLRRARDVRRWTRKAGVLFLVNDRPDIARLAEADGVHLGQDDLSLKDARRILGPNALIGISTHNVEQVRRAVLDGADYIGVGPVFASKTKEFGHLAGLEFVKAALAETSLPAFAIGGIDVGTLEQALAIGVRRVAVSHAIAAVDEPGQVARQMLSMLRSG
jgi:thiamine-phosphate pyrophosphorylase